MIFHLSAAGVPVSWTIEAIYKGSYGIAVASAEAWYAKCGRYRDRARSDSPQYVCEIEGSDAASYRLVRERLWMSKEHLQRQECDDASWLVQHHTAPLPLPANLGSMLTKALRSKLCEIGYLIPRERWIRRYPAQALTSQRFREFNQASEAWKAAHPHEGSEMPFEPRWTPFMATPPDFELPYGREGDQIVETLPDGTTRRTDPGIMTDLAKKDVDAAVRLLNSGWTPEETRVLLTPEPAGDA